MQVGINGFFIPLPAQVSAQAQKFDERQALARVDDLLLFGLAKNRTNIFKSVHRKGIQRSQQGNHLGGFFKQGLRGIKIVFGFELAALLLGDGRTGMVCQRCYHSVPAQKMHGFFNQGHVAHNAESLCCPSGEEWTRVDSRRMLTRPS